MLRYCLEIIPLKLTISEISQGNQVATRSCSFAPKTMINRQMERRTGRQTDIQTFSCICWCQIECHVRIISAI